MLPNPLHPALVHFPIVLMVLLPVAGGAALWAVRRGAQPTRAWLVPAAFALALVASTWVAVETGEAEEERVEAVVAESAVDGHADAAERFLLLSVVVAGLVAMGLLRNRVGAVSRVVSVAAAVGLLFAGYQVGHSGGALVYRHGAAAAYLDGSSPANTEARDETGRADPADGRRSEDNDDQQE